MRVVLELLRAARLRAPPACSLLRAALGSPQLAGRRREQPRRGRARAARRCPSTVGQVEVDRRDRDAPGRDRGEVGARLVVVAGVGAVDPVAARRPVVLVARASARRGRCACRGASTSTPSGVAGRDVDVQQRARAAAARPRARSTMRAMKRAARSKSKLAAEAEVHLARRRLLRDGDRRQPEHDALERRRDRARVGDVVAEVRAVVDAGRRSARARSPRPGRAGRSARSRPACRRSRSRRVPSSKSTSSTHERRAAS